MKTDIYATTVFLVYTWYLTQSANSEQMQNESFACKIIFQPEPQYEISAALKDLQRLEISHNDLCSFKTFKALDNVLIGAVSCSGTNVVELHSEASLNFELLLFQISCSAMLPLETNIEDELSFQATSDFIHGTHATFNADIRIQSRSENYWDSRVQHRSLAISGNYTFYYISNPELSIRFEIQVVPYGARFFLDGSWALRIHVSMDQISCERVSKDGSYADSNGLYLAFIGMGDNPTETRWQRRCLQTKGSGCLSSILGTEEWEILFRVQEIPPHGVAYCSYGAVETFLDFFPPVNSYDVLDMSLIWEAENVAHLQKDDGVEEIIVMRPGESSHETREAPQPAVFKEFDEAVFECHFLHYFLRWPVCMVKYENGTEVQVFGAKDPSTLRRKRYYEKDGTKGGTRFLVYSAMLKFRAEVGMIAIECKLTYWNYGKNITLALPMKIRSTILPSSKKFEPPGFKVLESIHSATVGSPFQLNCSADSGSPEPKYGWIFFPKDLRENEDERAGRDGFYTTFNSLVGGKVTATLRIPVFGLDMEGVYGCAARNSLGEAFRIFLVRPHENTDGSDGDEGTRNLWIYVGLFLGIAAVLAITLLVLWRKFYAQRGRLTAMEIQLFEKGDQNEIRFDNFAHANAQFMPYDRDFEIPWKDIDIFEEEKLGEGAYGVVYKGRLATGTGGTVAVKTVKPGAEKSVILALLSELKVMIHLGSHENIVKLNGACTSFLREGRVYVVIEYCPMGSLKSLLRKANKATFLQNMTHNAPGITNEEGILSDDGVNNLTTADLLRWSIQISKGMQHLKLKKVIHGDLAARNVLLLSRMQVKITDFGLSRRLFNYDLYVKTSQDKLPWRWLAPETLNSNVFSSASDVWSYGVTVWELFTLGLTPYPGMTWTTEFVSLLQQNLRLHQPQFASDRLYKIMAQCWELEPINRPDFQQLEEMLKCLA